VSSQTRGLLIALVGVSAWAFTAIFIAYLFDHYPLTPFTLTFWRALMMAAAVLIGLRIWQPAAIRITRNDLPFFLAYGFIGLAVFNTLWTFSVRFNGAAIATVLAYSSPAFTVLLARLFLREALTWPKLIAVMLSLAGCVLVVQAHAPETWRTNLAGIAVGLTSGLAFAFYNLMGRWSAGRFNSAWTVTGYGFLFCAAAMVFTQTPATLFSLGVQWEGWLVLSALALGPSLAGFGLYTLSMRYLEASTASLIATLEPVITALAAIPLLGEWMDQWQWLGAGLIVLAAVLAQAQKTPRARESTNPHE
jgi:drug/metabolite transporter (DMT)-like permease